MPVLPAAFGVTIPLPLEPDIEVIRRQQAAAAAAAVVVHNSSSSLCFITFNCSPPGGDTFVQLVLSHDVVYFLLPVLLLLGVVADIISACVLARLLRATRCRCHHDNDESHDLVYMSWHVTSSALLLVSGTVEILPEYYTIWH